MKTATSWMQRWLVVACVAIALVAALAGADDTETFAFSDGASSLSGLSFYELLTSLGAQAEESSARVHADENRIAGGLEDENAAGGEDRSAYSGGMNAFSNGACKLLTGCRVCTFLTLSADE